MRIGNAFVATPVADFQEPWAMTFLPDGRLLVTEKKGALKLLDVDSKRVGNISGVPQVAYGGQGGFGDVILHPQFASQLHRLRELFRARRRRHQWRRGGARHASRSIAMAVATCRISR